MRALADRGQAAEIVSGGADVRLDEAGNVVIRGQTLDGLAYQCIPKLPPRTDATTIICTPSTVALEHIAAGYTVALLEPRNDGERSLMRRLAASTDWHRDIDGRGAERVADLLCGTS